MCTQAVTSHTAPALRPPWAAATTAILQQRSRGARQVPVAWNACLPTCSNSINSGVSHKPLLPMARHPAPRSARRLNVCAARRGALVQVHLLAECDPSAHLAHDAAARVHRHPADGRAQAHPADAAAPRARPRSASDSAPRLRGPCACRCV